MTIHTTDFIANDYASPLVDYTYCETIDIDKCKILLANQKKLLKQGKWGKELWGYDIEFENEYTHLLKYFNKMNRKSKNNKIPVRYFHTKLYNQGRIYADNAISLGALRKEIRHTIAGELYYDFDVENAHPSVILQIAKKQDTCPYEMLEDYVKNRDERLMEVVNWINKIPKYADWNIGRDEAKKLYLTICYGGGVKGWWSGLWKDEEGKPNPDAPDAPRLIPDTICKFKKELVKIALIVSEKNPQLLTLMKELKKQNPERSTLSLFAQDRERLILEKMMEFFISKKYLKPERNGDYNIVLCFDGVMVLKKIFKNKRIDIILQELKTYIWEHTGFNLNFTEKTMDKQIDLTGYEVPSDSVFKQSVKNKKIEDALNKRVEFGEIEKDDAWKYYPVNNELEAMEKLLKLYPHFITTTEGENTTLWVYNDKTLMWSCNRAVINTIILDKAKNFLYLPDPNDDTGVNSSCSYAFTPRMRNAMIENLMATTIDNTKLKEIENSSLGKILFKNGYLDGTTFHSLTDVNPDIAFFNRVEADYTTPITEEDKKEMEDVRNKLFYNPLGKELGHYLLTFLSRALFGDTKMKLFPFLVGFSNTGKTTTYNAVKRAFNGIVGEFNIDCIMYNKNGSGDPAQKQRWALLNRYMRLMVASESGADKIDSRMYKTLSSAGDGLTARQHGGNETTFYPHFTCVGLTNQMPEFAPADDAVANRCVAVFYKRAFVDKVDDEEYHIAKDTEFEKFMNTPRFLEVLRWVLIDAYKRFLETGKMEFPESAKDNEFVSSAKTNDIDYFLEYFEITGIVGYNCDKVSVKEFNEWFASSKLKGSKTTLIEEIKKHAKLTGKSVEIGKSGPTRCYKGIKPIDECVCKEGLDI